MEISSSRVAERESSSSSTPRNKRKRVDSEWMCVGHEEVGDSDDLRAIETSSKELEACLRDGVASAEFGKVEEKVPLCIHSHMERILGELKQAKAELFQWMQQEIQNLLPIQSSAPGLPHVAEAQYQLEEGSSRMGCPIGASLLNSGGIQPQLGYGHTSDAEGFTEKSQSKQVSYRGPHGGGKSNIRKNVPRGREYVNPDKYKNNKVEVGTYIPVQKAAPLEHAFESNKSKWMELRDESRANPGVVAVMQDNRFVGFGSDKLVGLSVKPNMQGDTRHGAQVGVGTVMKYGVQRSGAAAVNFCAQVGNMERTADIRSSVVPGVIRNEGSLFRAFANERNDLMVLPGTQDSLALNIVQSSMQSERNSDHMLADFRIPSLNRNAHGKILNSGVSGYGGLTGNAAGYECPVGMAHAAVMQSANGVLGVQSPLSAENRFPSIGSSTLSMFMSMQNQVAMQDISSKQGFLGIGINCLSVRASANRQPFPGIYPWENLHHNMPSGKATIPTLSEHLITHGIQGLDTLELNA